MRHLRGSDQLSWQDVRTGQENRVLGRPGGALVHLPVQSVLRSEIVICEVTRRGAETGAGARRPLAHRPPSASVVRALPERSVLKGPVRRWVREAGGPLC